MYKFDSTSLAGGYIKQLLHSFNLPVYKVYTKEQAEYANNAAQKLSNLKIQIAKTNAQLKAKELIPEEQRSEQDKKDIANLSIKLTTLREDFDVLDKNKELNVLATFYRNNRDVYPDTLNWRDSTVEYPEVMTYVPYIKDNLIQEYVNGEWIPCHAAIDLTTKDADSHKGVHDQGGYYTEKYFLYDKPDLNWTKQLKINNNTYDSYTHEYLGDYLRFQRDYNGLNLMPLYNCFSNRTCNNLDISLMSATDSNILLGTFKSTDSKYKIYMLPVKLFAKYTIAIDCQGYIEMFCGLYDKYLNTNNKYKLLMQQTYMFMNSTQFIKPNLYDKLSKIKDLLYDDANLLSEIGINEENLKLFIKVPVNCKSSITVLEGDFTNCINGIFQQHGGIWERHTNHIAYNYTAVDDYQEFKAVTPLQLLKINTGESYPFSDSLIKYLSDMTITHLDENEDNIQRVLTVVHRNSADIEVSNLWTDKIKYVMYDYMNDNCNTEDANKDILGYVTPDVEGAYKTNFLPAFYRALKAYNDKEGTNYSGVDMTKLLKNHPELLDKLIELSPKLKVFKNLSIDEMLSIDQSIASIDIYNY